MDRIHRLMVNTSFPSVLVHLFWAVLQRGNSCGATTTATIGDWWDATGVTSGSNPNDRFMVVNGAGNSNVVTTSVSVVAGKSYEFSAYLMNLVSPLRQSQGAMIPPQIAFQYSIDGGTTWALIANSPTINVEPSAPTWRGTSSLYTATTTGNILIRVFSIAPSGNGNDFGLDELKFKNVHYQK